MSVSKTSTDAKTHRRISVTDIMARKQDAVPVVCLTAYTALTAKLLEDDVDLLLVGDSLGMVIYGMETTVGVSLDMMIAHGAAVVRGSSKPRIVVDLPFGSYQESPAAAFRVAARVMSETGCNAVKLEGGREMAETVAFLVERGIPVMGHIGLTPQSVHAMGGFKVQGKQADHGRKLVQAAKSLAHAGCYAIVLEGVPVRVAKIVTDSIDIPTIGIGAGMHTDGQVLVYHDLLGIEDRFVPKFVRRYADIKGASVEAVRAYAADVRSGAFPSHDEAYHMDDEQAAALEG